MWKQRWSRRRRRSVCGDALKEVAPPPEPVSLCRAEYARTHVRDARTTVTQIIWGAAYARVNLRVPPEGFSVLLWGDNSLW